MVDNNKKITLKIIILGSSEVGKTSILKRYFNNQFIQNKISTIGVDFITKYFKFNNQIIKCNYIDTAGQEVFKAIAKNYLKGTDGAVLVYDITKKESFDLILEWIEDIRMNNEENIGKILFGNKSDLSENREVSIGEGEQLASDLGCLYFEGSAKTGEKINEALNEIAKLSFKYYQNSKDNARNSISITSENNKNKKEHKKKEKCC